MTTTLRQIVPPAVEPVALADLKGVLRLDAGDSSWDATLTKYLLAARVAFESATRIRLITQTWILRAESFPGISARYDRNGFPSLALPFPPFQSVDFVNYVDTAGNVDPLLRDTSYGNDLPGFYGYQLEPGGGIQPARLTPFWARPWPPQRLIPANTIVQFRCGYGGPLTVSLAQNSTALTAPGFVFNSDQAPQLVGDTGAKIRIPGAGPTVNSIATDLVTYVASVDSQGHAVLKDSASIGVTGVTAWLGHPVPEQIQLAILFHAQRFFEKGAVTDEAMPRVIDTLRGPYKNWVS